MLLDSLSPGHWWSLVQRLVSRHVSLSRLPDIRRSHILRQPWHPNGGTRASSTVSGGWIQCYTPTHSFSYKHTKTINHGVVYVFKQSGPTTQRTTTTYEVPKSEFSFLLEFTVPCHRSGGKEGACNQEKTWAAIEMVPWVESHTVRFMYVIIFSKNLRYCNLDFRAECFAGGDTRVGTLLVFWLARESMDWCIITVGASCYDGGFTHAGLRLWVFIIPSILHSVHALFEVTSLAMIPLVKACDISYVYGVFVRIWRIWEQ